MVAEDFTIENVLDLLRERQGSGTMLDLANEIGVVPSYISDIYNRRRDPGPAILSPLGMEAVTVYRKKVTKKKS